MRQEKMVLIKQIEDFETTPKQDLPVQIPAHMVNTNATLYKDLDNYTQPPLSMPQCYQAFGT